MDLTAPRPMMDTQKVQDVLARFKLPAEVEKVDTIFGTDSTGDPSVTLTFHVRNEAHIGPEELKRLTLFLSDVTRTLLQADIGGFPYTRLEQAA